MCSVQKKILNLKQLNIKEKKDFTERSEKYNRYLKSKEWRELKAYLISKRGLKCEICGAKKFFFRQVHIHHITYARLFNELPSDLLILCVGCHKNQHTKKNKGKQKKKTNYLALEEIERKREAGYFKNNAEYLKKRSNAAKQATPALQHNSTELYKIHKNGH